MHDAIPMTISRMLLGYLVDTIHRWGMRVVFSVDNGELLT